SETPEGNLKWLAATSTAGTSDRLAAAKATFSTESADFCLSPPAAMASSQPIMVTKRAGQTRCKSVVKSNATAWSSAMQMSGQYGCNKVVKSVQLRTYMP
ncbi:hypothetical protein ACSETL_34330, partial [Pseudomonas aeruginosa]